MKVLGIESSCDETAVSVVDSGYKLLSSAVASSMSTHLKYGGVVPEIAARSHIEEMIPTLNSALEAAAINWKDIDAIAVSYGPGLSGSLLIGVMTARTLAIVHDKPLYPIDHVSAHVFANFITETELPGYKLHVKQPTFPMLTIIVSGGHSQLVVYYNYTHYKVLGQTQDDAVGEAFDKVAKLLGLPYPGGPQVAALAEQGNPLAYSLPKARMGKYDFSFSGPKTAVLRLAQSLINEDHNFPSMKLAERLNDAQKADIAASFQHVAIETIVEKAKLAFDEYQPSSVVIAGGVAASSELRRQLTEVLPLPLSFPDIKLCTDNAAMVATLGYFHAKQQVPAADPYTLDIQPNLSM
jgi:N6-L-threonylcarbamoyladenine synthase